MPPVNVLTNRYDNSRTGVNLQEDRLKVDNVNVATFGKVFGRTVDGDLYAQPLIVTGLDLGGKVRNVVFLATSRNWVYAYDADDPEACLPLWQTNLGLPVPRDEVFRAMGEHGHYLNFGSEIGITSTPAIDLQGPGVLYVVAKTQSGVAAGPPHIYRLHALNLLTGRDRKDPVVITATANKADGSTITFNPVTQLNRPGLLLLDGVLYLAFGSHGDVGAFYGWILAYDAASLALRAAYCTAPDWGEGGVWQSGCGLAGDRDRLVYAVVGNGERPSKNAQKHPPVMPPGAITTPVYGNAVLKLRLTATPQGSEALEVADWFTATDCFDLNETDDDLVAGPVLFEAAGADGGRKKMVLGGGKDGRFYLLDRDNLGKWASRTGGTPSHLDSAGKWIKWQGGTRPGNALQDDPICAFHIHGAPVIWKKSDQDLRAYVWSEKDFLAAIRFQGGKFEYPRRESTSRVGLPQDELRMPGGMLTLSANGSQDGTAIVWAAHPTDDDAMNKTVKGTLRAYDARDLNIELWNSDQDAEGADRVGAFAKFCPPVVANGKVYLATFSRELAVYGLLADAGKDRRDEAGIFTCQPFPWGLPGNCTFSCSRFDVTGAGKGLLGHEDGFFFAYRVIDSDEQPRISITARLRGINPPPNQQNQVCRAGVMIRKFDEHDKVVRLGYAAVLVTAANDVLFQRRSADGADSNQDGPIIVPPPCWLRLSCEKSSQAGFFDFRAEVSTDAVTWLLLSAATAIRIDGRVMVGLVVTAQTGPVPAPSSEKAHAVFSDVEVTPVV